jgi:lipopolysaccharide/colanic/teichoic acid biosynthesis glycosyltransferase
MITNEQRHVFAFEQHRIPALAVMGRRFYSAFEFIIAAVGLLLLLPIVALVSLAILLADGRPVFFMQTRVGRGGRRFQIVKFRSMKTGLKGARITADSDDRVTRVGRILRSYKLDELPQLWNVVKGEMAIVGPRPEVPTFVDLNDPRWQAVLSVKPGITDLATLVFRNEEDVLAKADDTEDYYRRVLLPSKLQLNQHYLQTATVWTNLRIIFLTLRFSFFRSGFDPDRIKRAFLQRGIE